MEEPAKQDTAQPEPHPDAARAIAALQEEGRFFFWGAGRETLLRLLGHLVRYSDLLLVLTGDEGSGKTTLVRAFLQSDTSGLTAWPVQAQEFMGADNLWLQLSAGIEPLKRAAKESAGGRIAALRAVAGHNLEEGKIGVLVIDDAHLLAEDALEFLADACIAVRDGGGLRILLTGEPQLQAHLEHSRLVDRMQGNCHYLAIDPMNRQEAQDYLGQRLGSAGMSIDEFSAKELDHILDHGNGLPGTLQAVATRVLRSGMPSERPKLAGIALIPRMHALAIGAVLLLIGLSYLVTGTGGDEPEPTTGTLQKPAVKFINPPRIVSARPELDRELGIPDPPAGLPVAERARLANLSEEPTLPPVVEEPLVEEPAQAPDTGPEEAAATPVADALQAAKPDAGQGGSEGEQRVATSLAPDLPTENVEDPETVAAKQRMSEFLEGRRPQQRSEEWLLEQSPGSYTVQVLGARREEAVAKFISEQETPEAFIYFRTVLKGKDWFVVVIGLHPNRAAATRSIGELPQSLRKYRPWARSLESIHKAIVEDRPA